MNTEKNANKKAISRKVLPKIKTLNNTRNMKTKFGAEAAITRGCSGGGCPQTSYCTYTC